MVALLIKWSVNNPLIVILATIALAAVGVHSFQNVNVEAYPDPAPAIVEVIAQNRGRSAEEMERLVTVPLEVALSGMPGLKSMRTKSLFGLSYVNTQFEYGFPYLSARQEVINRLATADIPDVDTGANVSPNPGDRGCRQFWRDDEAIRNPTRSGSDEALRDHSRSTFQGNRRQQRQC